MGRQRRQENRGTLESGKPGYAARRLMSLFLPGCGGYSGRAAEPAGKVADVLEAVPGDGVVDWDGGNV